MLRPIRVCFSSAVSSHYKVTYVRATPTALPGSDSSLTVLDATAIGPDSWLFQRPAVSALAGKLCERCVSLLDLPADISRGSSTGADEVFCLEYTKEGFVIRAGDTVEIEPALLRIPLYATDFTRYQFRAPASQCILFPYIVDGDRYHVLDEHTLRGSFPRAYAYLRDNRSRLQARKQFREWYGFSAPRNLHVHERVAILVPLLADRGLFSPAPAEPAAYCVMASAGFSVSFDPIQTAVSRNYLLGLLNSRLLFWRLASISNKFRGGWITCTKQYFGTLPIRTRRGTDSRENALREEVDHLVQCMLDLHKQLAASKAPTDKTAIQRQIDATDRQIDQLVYELYALTDDEIGIVEEATG